MGKILNFFKRALKSKSIRYGSSSIVLIALVVAVIVFINILMGMTSLKWDLTPNKLFSVSDTSKNILSKLTKDVEIYGLFDQGKINSSNDLKEISEVMKQYAEYKHVKIKFIDPDKTPSYLTDIYPKDPTSIQDARCVVKSGDRAKGLMTSDLFQTYSENDVTYKSHSKIEQAFTDAINTVTTEVMPKLYFTTGHGESKLDDNFKILKAIIKDNTYEIDSLDLILKGAVPADASILAVLSPQKDLTNGERDSIEKYFKNGGNAVFLLDPIITGLKLPNFEKILSEYYISLNYDKVMETNSSYHDPKDSFSIFAGLVKNAINNFSQDNSLVIISNSRSLNTLKIKSEDIAVTTLMKTSSTAIGVQILKSEGKNISGPLEIAVASENKGVKNPSKIIVLGNSKFLSDESINNYGSYGVVGLSFFVNSINWMQDKKDKVLVDSKGYASNKLDITDSQANITGIIAVVIFPLLILGFGLFIWLRRRHL